MFKPVQFSTEVEARVRWVEETDPTEIVEETYRELASGTPPSDLGEIACRDDFTEMHALKHFQVIADEYYATREPYRWLHKAARRPSPRRSSILEGNTGSTNRRRNCSPPNLGP